MPTHQAGSCPEIAATAAARASPAALSTSAPAAKRRGGRIMNRTLLLTAAAFCLLAPPASPRPAQESASRPSALFNTHLHASGSPWAAGDWVAFLVPEEDRDLNGDGDTMDDVLQIYDVATGQVWNTGLAAQEIRIAGDWAEADTPEAAQGHKDLNGDGDASDVVPQLVNLKTREVTNTRLPLG